MRRGLSEYRTLVGRETECRLIDGLLDAARGGTGSTLVLRGEAGIGKSALLDYAVRQAVGMRVLTARGIESESEISFSGLEELLHPLLDRLGKLPSRQAAALASALAIGPALAGDRFAVAAATLSLLAAAALDEPVLVAVDDLHWLDTSSAEALLFAARRIDAEPVALLFAARDEPDARAARSGIPEHLVAGLGRSASLALLASSGGGEIPDDVADRVVSETGGNPLALVEIPRLVSTGQLAGRDRLESPLPVGKRIERAFARRIVDLPVDARDALLVAAASDSRRTDVIFAAIRELGLSPAALERAEAAGLIAIGGLEVEFMHPLVRSSLCAGASAARLRSAHAALARALEGREGELRDRRAWHLAAASLEPDEDVAQALEASALGSSRRSGYSAAAQAYERSARLSPGNEACARRLLAAAEAWHLANRADRGIELLEEAAAVATGPILRADVLHLRARIDSWRGPALDAHRLLSAEAATLETVAPERAVTMLADATLAAITGGDMRLALAAAEKAHRLSLPVGGTVEVIAALQLGKAMILAGDSAAGYPLIMRCRELFDRSDPLAHAQAVAECAPALMSVDEYELADELLAAIVGGGRNANALGLLAYCLGAKAELEVWTGRWSSAYANGSEAIDLAREAGQAGQLSYNLARLARLEAAQGREVECRAHVAEALDLARGTSFQSTLPFAEYALGLLEVGLGRPEAAVEHLLRTIELRDRQGVRVHGRVGELEPELIEAYVRAGRRREAEEAMIELERGADTPENPEKELAEASGVNLSASPALSRPGWVPSTVAQAALCRARGLLGDGGDFDVAFAAARAWHAQTRTPFELARTELCHGEQLRRHGRRVDARRELRSALQAFDRLGATPWAERARSELAATGETVRARHQPGDALTTQELQVALVVAGGATNREAAGALFLTPKTVEFHLARVYRKLELRSRSELARHFAAQALSPRYPPTRVGPG